jgi:hypothetical protein
VLVSKKIEWLMIVIAVGLIGLKVAFSGEITRAWSEIRGQHKIFNINNDLKLQLNKKQKQNLSNLYLDRSVSSSEREGARFVPCLSCPN